jgi:lipopolysaccharide/colanic/teichoic acid biosynthesis glycosyltransferase
VQLLIKWCFDRLLALILLLALSPLLLLLALAVRLADGSPVFHREHRLGKGGKLFTLHKFRSMEYLEGPGIAADDDARITALGRRLRRSRLDELPGLFSVLVGDMSLVGPRPLSPAHAATLTPADKLALLSVRPGLTGASALAFIADDESLAGIVEAEAAYLELVFPAKVELELDYLDDWNLSRDLALLAGTPRALWSTAARRDSLRRVHELLGARR